MTGTKEKILLAALDLAAKEGLGAVSMSMIADKVGIRKPSLYNHFTSKEELTEAMYAYLRDAAKKKESPTPSEYEKLFQMSSAYDILKTATNAYRKMTLDPNMRTFYKVLYSERTHNPTAARILTEETEKMIFATKQLFYALEVHHLLHFESPDMSALGFAMTIHALMDYEEDCATGGEVGEKNKALFDDYLHWFCETNAAKEAEE